MPGPLQAESDGARNLVVGVARRLQDRAKASWLWHGLHAKLIDGFTFTMPDTPANQRAFPQQKNQRPGAGFPIARACAAVSLATAAILDLNIGPYEGKQTGETALLRGILECLKPGDVAVFDRCFCSFLMLAILRCAGSVSVRVCISVAPSTSDGASVWGRTITGSPGPGRKSQTGCPRNYTNRFPRR